ncbi:tyrP-A [Symbiodinium sp. CCMP2592]|nr:tyrP-A [Symbiodinium sp. CCMP2592]
MPKSHAEAILFGLMASAAPPEQSQVKTRYVALTLTFLVLYDLWSPIGDIYNFQAVLEEMVSGMEEELEARLAEAQALADDEVSSLGGQPGQV